MNKDLGRIRVSGQTANEINAIKEAFKDAPDAKINAKSVSFSDVPQTGGTGLVQEVLIKSIKTDVERFQNRDAEFSDESVERIVSNFDINRFDPVKVWRDPETNEIFMLSGHSRLEAFKRLKRAKIPAQFFQGSESEAIVFAKIDANRGATPETLKEDIKAYKLLRDGGNGVKKLTKAELKARFKNLDKMEAFSFLNPDGNFMKALNDPTLRDEAPYIENRSQWVGAIRKFYPKFTNAHEDEVFKYFYIDPPAFPIVKDQFMQLMEEKLSRFDFNPSEPLLLKGGATGTQARADTAQLEKRLTEIKRENKELSKRLNAAQTASEKQTLTAYIKQNLDEAERINRDLGIMLKTQNALFGTIQYTGRGSFPYDPSLDRYKRHAYQETDFSQMVTGGDGSNVLWGTGGVDVTIACILATTKKGVGQVKKLANYLKTANLEKDCYRVWHWLKTHLTYKLDTRGKELVRTPARFVADGVGDCEDFAIFAAALLIEMGYKPMFWIVKFGNNPQYGHIYTVCGNYIIDAVVGQFNTHPPNVSYVMEVYALNGVSTEREFISGLGNANPPETLSVALAKQAATVVDSVQAGKVSQQNAGKELRKLNAFQMMVGTPAAKVFTELTPFIDDVTPDGNLILKKGTDVDTVAKYAAIMTLKAEGKLPPETDPEVSGLGEILTEIEKDLGDTYAQNTLQGLGNLWKRIKRGVSKAWKKVKKVAGKVGHGLLKVFPVTFAARAGFRAAMELNLFKMAKKISWGYLSDEEAKKLNVSPERLSKFRKMTAKIEGIYHGMGGERSSFRKMVLRGAKIKKELWGRYNHTEFKRKLEIAKAKKRGLKGTEENDEINGVDPVVYEAVYGFLEGVFGDVMGYESTDGIGVIALPAVAAPAAGVIATVVGIISKVTKAAGTVNDVVNTVKSATSTEEEGEEEEQSTDGLGAKKAKGKKKKKKGGLLNKIASGAKSLFSKAKNALKGKKKGQKSSPLNTSSILNFIKPEQKQAAADILNTPNLAPGDFTPPAPASGNSNNTLIIGGVVVLAAVMMMK